MLALPPELAFVPKGPERGRCFCYRTHLTILYFLTGTPKVAFANLSNHNVDGGLRAVRKFVSDIKEGEKTPPTDSAAACPANCLAPFNFYTAENNFPTDFSQGDPDQGRLLIKPDHDRRQRHTVATKFQRLSLNRRSIILSSRERRLSKRLAGQAHASE